uniref:Interleukin-5 n=1 Tax=Callithrix jacchus TaxID=9483 RepID=A0A2R8M598_CALJA
MRMLLHLSLLALGAAHVCANPTARPTSALVKETLALLSIHRPLLMVNEVIFCLIPTHQLCTEEIFQGIGTLENQAVQGSDVEKLFQNLSLIKEHIDRQKKKCGQERRRVKQFLDYLQEFLGVINTEWIIES